MSYGQKSFRSREPSELIVEFISHGGLGRVRQTLSKLGKGALLWQNFLGNSIFANWVDQRVSYLHEEFGALETKDHASAVLVKALVALGLQNDRELVQAVEEVHHSVETLLDVRVKAHHCGSHVDLRTNHVKGGLHGAVVNLGHLAAIFLNLTSLGSQEKSGFKSAHELRVIIEKGGHSLLVFFFSGEGDAGY